MDRSDSMILGRADLPLPAEPARGEAAVTAVVIAKNEEANIEACLSRLLWADRILVIDNGSTDATAAISARYTLWILHRPEPCRIDPGHENLNHALGLVPEGWVLQVDADERVPADLALEIRRVMAGAPHAAFRIPFRTAILGRWMEHGYWGRSRGLVRLFRAGRARYPLQSVHETIEVDGTIGQLESPIHHLCYRSFTDFVERTNRYTSRDVERILGGGSSGISGLGRRALHPSGARILWSSVRLFLWAYLRRGGWRDGRHGLVTSAMLAVYGFVETVKVWEAAEGLDRPVSLPADER